MSDPFWFPDCDGDGYAPLDVVALAVQNCTEPAPMVGCAGGWTARRPSAADVTSADCNDANPEIRPLATELAGDGVDQSCDTDETCYEDADNDGYRRIDGRTVASSDVDCTDCGVVGVLRTCSGTTCGSTTVNRVQLCR